MLRVDGGMTASDWTMQRLADMLDAPVDRPTVLETTALGAAYLAGLQAGIYPAPAKFADNWRLEHGSSRAMSAATREAELCGLGEGGQRACSRVIGGIAPDDAPDGTADVPARETAAAWSRVWRAGPAPRPDPAGAWSLRRVEILNRRSTGARDLYGRVGQAMAVDFKDADARRGIGRDGFNRRRSRSTLWRMTDATKACSRLDFCAPRAMAEGRLFWAHRKTCRNRRRPLADEPRAGDSMVAADGRASGSAPAPSIIPQHSPSTSGRASVRFAGRSKW